MRHVTCQRTTMSRMNASFYTLEGVLLRKKDSTHQLCHFVILSFYALEGVFYKLIEVIL